SFTVGRGEFVTLVGPSGCGKTTLLRIIAGLELADRGEVRLSGRAITDVPARHRPVNTVFQNYALFPHLSVQANVAFGLRARRFPRADVRRRVGQALRMLQMEELVDRYPHELSGGQKQRVALARALVNEPQVLLLDEPLSALDAKLRGEVQIELRRLQRRLGTTFILVTHDQDEAMTVSDRLMVMRAGRIEQSGAPAEVYERPGTRFVAEFLGAANLMPAARRGTRVETPHGLLAIAQTPPWERGTVAIRPERIRVLEGDGAAPAAGNVLSTRVDEVVYRGDHVDLYAAAGALRVRTWPRPELRPGAQLRLELPPEHLVALED
ncbi:MAG: ABC transporter ATP-binding protein, partial [Phycisphaerae bacterium]